MPEIELLPGVVSTPTNAKNTANWRAANLIRWTAGAMEPIQPWERYGYATDLTTTVRALHQWRDNSNRTWNAYLTEDDVYVEFGGDLYSIQPSPALGIYLPPDGGYGDGIYSGDLNYGEAPTGVVPRDTFAPAFTLDNWGENLLIMSSVDGRLLEWVPPVGSDPPDPSALVANSPSGRSFVVTPERHVIIFQQDGNPSEFAWCDKEDNTNWSFADVASEAGTLPVEPASPISVAKSLGSIGTLFWTLRRAYISRYIGKPNIYNADEIGETGTPLSPSIVARAGDQALWMAESGVWKFNGVSIEPVDCPIWPWIWELIDLDATRSNGNAVNISARTEIWFFFSDGSLVTRNTHVAIYNYRENWWSQGYFGRNCGYADDALANPIMADGLIVYKHESGNTFADVAEGPWLESFVINAGGGDNMNLLRQIMPEVKAGNTGRLSFQLATRDKRNDQDDIYQDKKKIQEGGNVDFMQKSRDFRIRISVDDTAADFFRIGNLNLNISPVGKRGGKKG